MKRIFFILFILISTFEAKSQIFAYQAKINKVDSSGYYHIFMPPAVTAKLNYKFSDIRIYDKKGKEIPYIRFSEDQLFKTSKFTVLKILANQYKRTKKFTQVLVHNNKKLKINNFVLIVDDPKNSEVWVNIAGSNDRKNWNVLKNNSRYLPEYTDSATAEVRIIDLPESNFNYYRIMVFDFGKLIFNVHKVINYKISNYNEEYVEVPKPSFEQDDTTESNKTIVKIKFDEPQYIDKIKFKITYPPYYLRKAEITKKDTTSGKKIRLQLYDQNQKDFYLCSDSSNTLHLSRYNVQTLFLIVYNNDDEPLKFSDVEAFQRKEYLIAYLEKGKNYIVKFGNSNVAPPIYDLKFFKNKIPQKCPVTTITGVKKIIRTHSNKKNIYIKPVYLWIAFAVVVLILTLISLKMFVINAKNGQNAESVD